MKKLYFEDTCEFAEEMFGIQVEGNDVCLIADREIVSEVLQELFIIADGTLYIMDISIGIPECVGYNGPYLITLTTEGEVWVQEAWSSSRNRLVFVDDDFVYVQEKYANDAKDINLNNGEIIEIHFGKEEPTEDKLGFKIITDQDDEPCGFEYRTEGDGYCYNMRYCSCDPVNIDDLIKTYNNIVENVVKLM